MTKLKCEECEREGKESEVELEGVRETLMHIDTFYDRVRRFHRHNPNRRTTTYKCSKGHKWKETYRSPCPAMGCNFNREG